MSAGFKLRIRLFRSRFFNDCCEKCDVIMLCVCSHVFALNLEWTTLTDTGGSLPISDISSSREPCVIHTVQAEFGTQAVHHYVVPLLPGEKTKTWAGVEVVYKVEIEDIG